ncbi:MAG: DUF1552 domain-containing protein [Myxococcales bacterium]
MSSPIKTLGRRHFLKGVGGVTLGLPILEAFLPKRALAATAAPPFLCIVSSANGVVQARPGEAEAWWPTKPGALTTASMTADQATRASGELASYAAKLLFVRGIGHALGANGCNHASACAQLLTASATLSGNSNQTAANAESVDTTIATALNAAGVGPLFLHVGMYQAGGSGFNVPSYISYIGAKQQRTAIDSPLKAYQRITGNTGMTGGGSSSDPLALRRKSVNDLLRKEIQALQARPELTADDKQRLDQHLSTIRDTEIKISTATMSAAQIASMTSVDPKPYDTNNHEVIQDLHQDLMVFAISSGYTRVAVLQVGDREDDHEYTLGGVKTQFHTASHRTLANSYELCKQIDRIQIKHFKYLLDKLSGITTPTGTLLDQGVTVNTNQIGTGPDHSMTNLPYILAGSANGFLAQGKFIDATPNTPNAQMLNTLAAAVGVKTTMGGKSGTIGQLLA